jgi:hypothetical protein
LFLFASAGDDFLGIQLVFPLRGGRRNSSVSSDPVGFSDFRGGVWRGLGFSISVAMDVEASASLDIPRDFSLAEAPVLWV